MPLRDSKASSGARARSKALHSIPRSELWEKMNIPEYLRPKFQPYFDEGLDRQKFLDRIGRLYPPGSAAFNEIVRADNSARTSFVDIVRDNGEPYHEHVRWAALICSDYLGFDSAEAICISLLHDTGEDDPQYPHRRLAEDFGREVAVQLSFLSEKKPRPGQTKEEGEREHFRIMGKNAADHTIGAKAADRAHNFYTIWPQSPDRIARKIISTEYLLLPILRERRIFYHEMIDTIRTVKSRLHI